MKKKDYELIGEEIKKLMSSPELLSKQVERWFNNKVKGVEPYLVNIDEIKKEISKLKDQESRYTKAYGGGIITMEQLKEYITPMKEKISIFENQINMAQLESKKIEEKDLPHFSEIEAFTQKTRLVLRDLSFSAKKAIIKNIIDKVVGTKNQLQVYGYIPVTSNINVFTEYRNRRTPKRR